MRWVPLVVGLVAGRCTPAPVAPEITVHRAGLEVADPGGVSSVEVRTSDGRPLVRQWAPVPVDRLEVLVPWAGGGAFVVRVDGTPWPVTVSRDLPVVDVVVSAPAGQPGHPVEDGERVPLTTVAGEPVQVAVTARTWVEGEVAVDAGGQVTARVLTAGERLVALFDVHRALPVRVDGPDTSVEFVLEPMPISAERARERLRLVSVQFPAEPGGQVDPARPAGRVTLPSPGWQWVMDRAGLGFRPHDIEAPWGWWAVTLENTGESPMHATVQARVLDETGAPAAAFRPYLRGADDGTGRVSALVRVPPGRRATLTLPLHVQPGLLGDPRARVWEREIAVVPLGASNPLHVDRAPLYVSRGSTAASSGLALALLAAALGLVLVLVRSPVWLVRTPTADLMTIALFGSLSFLASAAGKLVATGVAAVLGPFAVLLSALADDVLRYAVLATLITLVPRPGTAALATIVGWVVSAVALGMFGPVEVLLLGSSVLWLEGALWVTGVTRAPSWRDEGPGWRWARLGLAFGIASVLSTAVGLAMYATLYRLYWAAWYVVLVLAVPGFLYVLVATALAVPFADSLRRIQR